MNPQEEVYFDALTKHRARLADALDDLALRGVKNSIVEKYSDQAHFIYELLHVIHWSSFYHHRLAKT